MFVSPEFLVELIILIVVAVIAGVTLVCRLIELRHPNRPAAASRLAPVVGPDPAGSRPFPPRRNVRTGVDLGRFALDRSLNPLMPGNPLPTLSSRRPTSTLPAYAGHFRIVMRRRCPDSDQRSRSERLFSLPPPLVVLVAVSVMAYRPDDRPRRPFRLLGRMTWDGRSPPKPSLTDLFPRPCASGSSRSLRFK